MNFDGAYIKEDARAGITISAPYFIKDTIFSYKFYFSCTNNVAECEALLLGIQIIKKMQAKRVYIYGDSELLLGQVIGTYRAKHPRMRDCKNMALDILECFDEYHIFIIPRI